MAERVPPPIPEADELPSQHGRRSSLEEPNNEQGRTLSSLDVEDNNPRPLILAQGTYPREANTLVIQIPKDQIYRVPPPENAKIVEAYRNPEKKKGQRRFTPCLWVFASLVLIVAVIGITILVIQKVYKPEAATFSIVDVYVTNKTRMGYQFTLKSNNPSENLGIKISSGGDTSLVFKSHKLSTGEFPELSLQGHDSKNVHITLNGTKSGLPKEIDESMNDEKSSDDDHVSLELNMDVSAKFSLGFLNFWGKKDIEVDCKFKVNSLKSSGNKILSQKCDSKIK